MPKVHKQTDTDVFKRLVASLIVALFNAECEIADLKGKPRPTWITRFISLAR